jgi:hypothetical protein
VILSPKSAVPVMGVVAMATLTAVQDALLDHRIDSQEWVLVGLGVLMAFNVWATANLPQYTKMKTYVAAAIAVAGALHASILGGLDLPEVINMTILGLTAMGVAFVRQPVTTVINGETVPPQHRMVSSN